MTDSPHTNKLNSPVKLICMVAALVFMVGGILVAVMKAKTGDLSDLLPAAGLFVVGVAALIPLKNGP